jgi:1-phosphofructokinase family hexose kinase
VCVAPTPAVDRLHELNGPVTVGEIHRPERVVAVAGGKGLNAARAAATLGGSVMATGIVAGRAGDWIEEQLAELGIESRLARAAGETRTCVSVLDRSSGAMTEIYERGAQIDAAAWESLEAILWAELERGDVAAVALSGSLLPGAPPDGFARIARIALASSRTVPVLADTYGPALPALLGERPAILKVNAVEAGDASGVSVGDARSAASAGRILRDAGAACVIVTIGLEGAVVVGADDPIQLIPPGLRGAYPVGSGDAFLGGLAIAFARGDSVVEAARLGLAAGIANAFVPGAGELDPASIAGILVGITQVSL